MTDTTDTDPTERAILAELQQFASTHMAGAAGMMAVLDVAPERYPAQRLHYATGQPIGPHGVRLVASVITPQFDHLVDAMLDDTRQSEALTRAGEILETGGNVIVATNHRKLVDPGIALAAVDTALRETGHGFAAGIMISRMVSLVGYNLGGKEPTPAVNALQMLCDHIYLTFPQSPSIQQSDFKQAKPDRVQAHNRAVKAQLARQLGTGGLLLAMAPGGATDKPGLIPGRFTMGRVSDGTAQLMVTGATHVLPVAIELDTTRPTLAIVDTPRYLHEPRAAHTMMRDIARYLNTRPEADYYDYDHVV